MKDYGLLSVIVPVYNAEKYLGRCISSIINQAYRNLEVLLIDDGSTDNSGKLCDEYASRDGRIKTFHSANSGPSAARNIGLLHASGTYITFVDSDDYLEFDAYERLLKVMNERNVSVISSSWKIIDESGEITFPDIGNTGIISSKKMRKYLISEDWRAGGGFVWNKIFEAKVLRNHKILFPTEIKVYEDKLWCMMVLENIESVFVCNYRGYNYYINHESLTHAERKGKREEYKTAWALLEKEYGKALPIRAIIKKWMEI